MFKNRIFKDIFRVIVSNIMTILSGVIVGFMLPKLLPIVDYGYYKTYALYISYIGICSLGIMDGVALKYGGKDLEELEMLTFRFYLRIVAALQIIFTGVIALISIIFLEGEIKIIILLCAATIIPTNLTGFFQHISQITCRFSEYSARNVIKALFSMFGVCVVFIAAVATKKPTYVVYTSCMIISNYIMCVWYISTYKDYVFGKANRIADELENVKELSQIGFPLMLANLCTTFILAIDRQFVSVLFETETYAMYAFAYNMLALVTVATSAMSIVLYPNMKRSDEIQLIRMYPTFITIVLMFVSFALCLYFPLSKVVLWFLPKYETSLFILRIIFPGLVMDSAITVIMQNYYKTQGLSSVYFKISLAVLVISIIANYIAYVIFGITSAISIASVIILGLWYVIADWYLVKKNGVCNYKNSIYLILIVISFYIISGFENLVIGFVLYVVFWIIISYVLFHNTIKVLKNRNCSCR